MPVDTFILDPMLGTFRTMVADCKAQNISGESFDKMCETLDRMEQLGQELDDINTFNAQLMQENLFAVFSDFYGKALSEQAQASSSSQEGGYNDAALLKQSIDGLKQAIKANRDRFNETIDTAKNYDPMADRDAAFAMAKKMGIEVTDEMREVDRQQTEQKMEETPNAYDNSVEVEVLQNPDDIIKPIQDIIDLGEQEGMTFPKFLRLQIEMGLDKAMEGAIVARQALETEKDFVLSAPVSPYHIQRIEKKIEAFDRLASAHKFNVPNWKELNFAYNDIDREFEPKIIKFDKITKMWEKLISDLSFWSLSYCSFAPNIEPWSLASNPRDAVIETQKITPGIFKERLKLAKKYFGMDFPEILNHETFKWAVEYNYISNSQEYIKFLIEEIYPLCLPFNDLPSNIIKQKEELYHSNKEGNPQSHIPVERQKEYYDRKFGEGRYQTKYGAITKSDSNAEAWNINTFNV